MPDLDKLEEAKKKTKQLTDLKLQNSFCHPGIMSHAYTLHRWRCRAADKELNGVKVEREKVTLEMNYLCWNHNERGEETESSWGRGWISSLERRRVNKLARKKQKKKKNPQQPANARPPNAMRRREATHGAAVIIPWM